MARERSSGAGASVIGMVVFGFLFFISMILAILFYTQIADERKQREEAQSSLARYVKPAETAQVQALLGQMDKEGSVVAQLLAERNRLRGLLSPDEQLTFADLQSRMQELDIDPASGAIQALRDLKADEAAKSNLVADLQGQLTTVNEEKESIAQEAALAQRGYDESVASLKSEIDTLQTQIRSHLDRIAELRRELEGTLGQTQETYTSNLRDRDSEIQSLEQQVVSLQTIIDKDKGSGVIAVDPIRTVDGEIVSIFSEDNLVTLNLGAKDKVPAGLTFEVYDKATGIVLDEERPELRGKATIEVVNVRDNTSVARVVKIERGAVLSEGDVIVNVVYDRNRIHKFTVFGDFDLENKGAATVGDRRRVETMISRWGGELLEDLSYDTDFLVLGVEPVLPDPLPADVIDPVRIAQDAALRRQFSRYQELRARAAEMKVPILNQNRFLHLVGYYTRY